MNCPPPGAGPTTRIAWLPVSSMISKESTIADHTVMVRMSTSWSIAGGRSALASSRRCCPILMATARAPMLLRICRASESGTMPERRGIQHQRRGVRRRQPVVQPVHPEIGDRGHVDQHSGDHHQRNGQQQQLAGQAEPARRLRPRRSVALVGWFFGHGHDICLRCLGVRGCVLPANRSNYGSLMSAGSRI